VFDDQCRDEAAEPDLSRNRKHQPVPTLWNEPRLVTDNGCLTSNTEDYKLEKGIDGVLRDELGRGKQFDLKETVLRHQFAVADKARCQGKKSADRSHLHIAGPDTGFRVLEYLFEVNTCALRASFKQ